MEGTTNKLQEVTNKLRDSANAYGMETSMSRELGNFPFLSCLLHGKPPHHATATAAIDRMWQSNTIRFATTYTLYKSLVVLILACFFVLILQMLVTCWYAWRQTSGVVRTRMFTCKRQKNCIYIFTELNKGYNVRKCGIIIIVIAIITSTSAANTASSLLLF